VQAAINNEIAHPVDGDIIAIPAGTCTWAGTTVTANFKTSVTIQGAGAISSTTGGASATGTDQTVFINHVSGNNPLMSITTTAGKSFRLTGIAAIEDSGTINPRYNGGSINIRGKSSSVRVDHCHFTIFVGGSKGLAFNGSVTGVADHIYINTTQTITNNFVFENGGTWGSDTGDYGNGSWADTDHWGSSQFIFVEDSRSDGGYISDCGKAGRYVFRHSTAVNTNALFEHGTHDQFRGCRAVEAYNNTFSNPNAFTDGGIVHSHSGTALVWGNTITNFKNAIDLGYYRITGQPYGTSPAPSNGFGMCGNVTGGPSVWDSSSNGYICLDQPSRGGGDLLTNYVSSFSDILNSATGMRIWPHQALSPVYVWNNTLSGSGPSGLLSIRDGLGLADNRDYYQQFGAFGESGSFDGTRGVGQGLDSAKPGTCTAGPGGNNPGVGYWATDTNKLYVCNPTNAWTVYYAPYTYPHPLTQSSSSSATTIAPPEGLSATVQ